MRGDSAGDSIAARLRRTKDSLELEKLRIETSNARRSLANLVYANPSVLVAALVAAGGIFSYFGWRVALRRDLEKIRGAERQELRYKSYGALWEALRPLAIYHPTPVDRTMASRLSDALTNWYFSESGGLLLTPQARDFYFALQDLLRATGSTREGWTAAREPRTEHELTKAFRDVLDARKGNEAIEKSAAVHEYFATRNFKKWEAEAPGHGKAWREGIGQLSAAWSEIRPEERFPILQQVGSVLRSSLTNDLESRLR